MDGGHPTDHRNLSDRKLPYAMNCHDLKWCECCAHVGYYLGQSVQSGGMGGIGEPANCLTFVLFPNATHKEGNASGARICQRLVGRIEIQRIFRDLYGGYGKRIHVYKVTVNSAG